MRVCVRVCTRTETRKPSHQLKRTRFDGVAENNGRIGVQKRGRGRKRKMGRYAEGRVAWRAVGEVLEGVGVGGGCT